ncbi:Hypothetical protein RAK1035_2106 [Roseovarius sp. AK1035]|jgi:hypothetical protein|nr:Hypothetical protein RAK1035_2106 [Roseovarius sp. AK1035]
MTSYWPTSSITEQFPIDLRLDAVLVGDAGLPPSGGPI